jgi:hypothetical protein
MHEYIRYSVGRATGPCSGPGCTAEAQTWAWLRTGPSATEIRGGKLVTYGLEPSDYAPMCYSHNGRMDHGGTLTHCPNGHDRKVGVSRFNGACIECVRDRDREYQRRKRAARVA